MKRRRLPLLASLLLAACSDIAHAGERTPGIIQSQYLTEPALVAPESVTAGIPFAITVSTLGFSGCWRADASGVSATPSEVTVTPYDRVLEVACTQALISLHRSLQLRFDQRGTARIRVRGVRDDGSGSRRVEISQAIVVR